MYYALTLGHQITGRQDLKAWTLAGGANFANIFDRKANAFLQIAGARTRIVIDTGLNLPSMLWASQWEPERAALAYRHLDTVLEIGLLRADGSSCHAAALHPETRAVTGLFSLQGWSNDSVWARGQAWAMLGFFPAYEASRKPHYLEAARSAADWYVAHAPQGWVPRYDYNDPDRDNLPYNSCAACIATAVLLRLARWLPDRAQRYQDVARETLKVLLADFLTPGGVVLHGSWGRMRHVEAGKPRLGRFPQEDVMPYGNYWIAECLYRELSTDWSILSLDGESLILVSPTRGIRTMRRPDKGLGLTASRLLQSWATGDRRKLPMPPKRKLLRLPTSKATQQSKLFAPSSAASLRAGWRPMAKSPRWPACQGVPALLAVSFSASTRQPRSRGTVSSTPRARCPTACPAMAATSSSGACWKRKASNSTPATAWIWSDAAGATKRQVTLASLEFDFHDGWLRKVSGSGCIGSPHANCLRPAALAASARG